MDIDGQQEIEKLINELNANDYSTVNYAADVAVSRCNIKKSKRKHAYKLIYEFTDALGINNRE